MANPKKVSSENPVLNSILREDTGTESMDSVDPESTRSEDKLGQAPAFIPELSTSEPPKPTESRDIEYLAYEEKLFGKEHNTLEYVLIPDFTIDSKTWGGPWSEMCLGMNPQTGKMMVTRVPARQREIPPNEVLQYLGSVVSDHQSVRSEIVPFKGHHGYCFDRFYFWNGAKQPRCSWVPDHIHQAYLIFEKAIHYRSRKPFARIRRLRGPMGSVTSEVSFRVLLPKSQREGYYRDLKRLFERHFISKDEEEMAEDVGLKILVNGQA